MKTLTTNQENARAAGGHSVSRFLSLQTANPQVVKYYSERGTSVFNPDSSKTFIPLLQSAQIRERSANMGLEELPKVQRLDFTIRVSNKYETPIDIQVDDAAGAFIGREVVYYKVFRNLPGVADPTETDWIEMWRGEIEEVKEIAFDRVSFTCVDFMKRKGENRANRTITRTLFPNCPEKNLGDVMPIIFGPVTGAPGIQVDEGNSSALTSRLEVTDTVIHVADASVFRTESDPLKVQIGTEKIAYATVDTDDNNLILTDITGRGIDGTTVSEHNVGQVVTQLGPVKFLIADQDLTHNDTVDFMEPGTVTDATGAVYNTDLLIKSHDPLPGSDHDSTFIEVPDGAFPDITEIGTSANDFDLAELAVPIAFQNGAENTVSDWANAVATGDDKGISAANITEGNTLHVQQSNDLSGNTSAITKAKAFIDYSVVPSEDSSWPTSPPIRWGVIQGDLLPSGLLGYPDWIPEAAELKEPEDVGPALTDTLENSQSQFEVTSGSTGSTGSFPILTNGSQPISLPTNMQNSTVTTFRLFVSVDVSDDDTYSRFVIRYTTGVLTPFGVSQQYQFFVKVGAQEIFRDSRVIYNPDLAEIREFEILAEDSGLDRDFTKADLENLTMNFQGVSANILFNTYLQIASDWVFLVTEDSTFRGADDPLISNTNVYRQELDITDFVPDWSFFDGASSTTRPGIMVAFGDDDGNGYRIKIHNAGFLLDVVESSARAVLPSEYTLRADCTGIKSGSLSTLPAQTLISKILGNSGFYGLQNARVDTTSLTGALTTIAGALPSDDKDDWVLSRRLVQPLTNRELLGQTLTDCSLRAVIEGGQVKFFPSISAEQGDNVRDIDGDKTVSPVRQSTNIALVSNDLTIQYDESTVSPGKFQDEINVKDSTSVNDINPRITTYQSHFIKDDDVAQAWADLSLDDFAFARAIVNLSMYGPRNMDLEVGDAVSLTDTYTRFFGQVGRIVSISRNDDEERTVLHQLALTNKRLIIWQHGVIGDSDYSTIEVNTFTQTLFFRVDNVLVAKLFGDALQIKGNLSVDLITSSVENTVNDAEISLDRANNTGIIEYLDAPVGFSGGFIAIGVHNGADDKYYRIANLGYNETAGANFHDSLFLSGDHEDNSQMPVDLSDSFTFDNYVVPSGTGANDGNVLMTGDKRRMYLAFNKFLNSGAINGRMIVNEIQTGVNLG